MAAVTFDHVTKWFRRHAGRALLSERLMNALRSASRERFLALQDVSFTLESGHSLAVIGRNGAGKSTLLNIATGLCRPSLGTTAIHGRVAPLLELGAGFHQDLTGAENLRLNAAVLGLTRQQFRQRFDKIVEFSEIGEFIDDPLRTYSQGMSMRLAFSLAVNVDPDVLIIDEVLGVGDQAFFQKCLDRILSFRHAGKSLLCVSHSLESLEMLCERAIWLEHGRVKREGPLHDVISAYRDSCEETARPA